MIFLENYWQIALNFFRFLSYTVWGILAKAVNDLSTLLFQYRLLIGQEDFRTNKMSLRRHSSPVFERQTILGFAKLGPYFVFSRVVFHITALASGYRIVNAKNVFVEKHSVSDNNKMVCFILTCSFVLNQYRITVNTKLSFFTSIFNDQPFLLLFQVLNKLSSVGEF